jgi:hypothetical protein
VNRLFSFITSVALTLLCSCSTTSTPRAAVPDSVRSVDFSAAPGTKALAERVRQVGNEMYPKVCALLADGNSDFPRRFDICLKKRVENGHSGETRITHIYLNAGYLDQFKNDPAALDQLVVHEMAHVAQHYYRPILGGWVVLDSHPPFGWEEGMADYVCFKLGETNGLDCPQCGFEFPHYRNGYSCAGAFLLYLDTTYNSNIVRQLNTVLRQGKYSDRFFIKATGKELAELWAEFQRTPAFTPNASRMLELQQTLGFADGRPPKDVEHRFKMFVYQHTDTLTKDLLKSARVTGLAPEDIQTRMAVFLYFTQPGGTRTCIWSA